MKRKMFVLIAFSFSLFLNELVLAREPTKQPPITLFQGGQVELSPDFVDYLLEIKDYSSQYEIFRTVRYNFPEIQNYAREFQKNGQTQLNKKRQSKREKELIKMQQEYVEEVNAWEKRDQELSKLSGKDIVQLFQKIGHENSELLHAQKEYLDFLSFKKKRGDEKLPGSYITTVYLCIKVPKEMRYKTGLATLKKILKSSKLSKNQDFLNNSAEPTLRELMKKEFPCS